MIREEYKFKSKNNKKERREKEREIERMGNDCEREACRDN
jgi:hypothetical protein